MCAHHESHLLSELLDLGLEELQLVGVFVFLLLELSLKLLVIVDLLLVQLGLKLMMQPGFHLIHRLLVLFQTHTIRG